MNKKGLLLLALTIINTVITFILGFKMPNALLGCIIGFLSIIGITFMMNIFEIAKQVATSIESSTNVLSMIKNIFLSFLSSFDMFIIIGQLVFYLLIVMKNPNIFIGSEFPKFFKTKNTMIIMSIFAQISMTIARTIMEMPIFSEIIILLGVITAFVIYDVKTDIEKKKVDKYSYK